VKEQVSQKTERVWYLRQSPGKKGDLDSRHCCNDYLVLNTYTGSRTGTQLLLSQGEGV